MLFFLAEFVWIYLLSTLHLYETLVRKATVDVHRGVLMQLFLMYVSLVSLVGSALERYIQVNC